MRAVPALLLLVLVVTVTVPSSALDCYACRPNRNFTVMVHDRNVTLQLESALEALAKFPTCEVMDEEPEVSDKFKQRCPATDFGCAKFVDPEDDENIIRTCFPVDEDECDDSACYCIECLMQLGSRRLGVSGDDDRGVWCDHVGVVTTER